jgi:endonuclease G
MKKSTALILVALLFVLASSPQGSGGTTGNGPTSSPQPSSSLHLTLGNPSSATTSTTNRNNFLMVKPQFVLSYNNRKGGPNWVSWHLQASDVGDAERLNRFHPDPDLPAGFKRIITSIYTNTGYERGHLCNSEDRTETQEDNDATFAMTNILPQTADNNKGPWVKFETFSRRLLDQGNELYIVAGGFGTKGSFGVANRKVNIPRIFWKVAVVLPTGTNDLSRINSSTRTIAICMPNVNGIRAHDWRRYVATIRNVEAATGYDFLSEVSSTVQDALETQRDAEATNTRNPCR